MHEDGIEFYEDTLELVTCFTYFPPVISKFMWSLLPRSVVPPTPPFFISSQSHSSLVCGDLCCCERSHARSICESYHKWAADYVNNMLAPIDNYMSRGTEVFLTTQNPNYVKMVMDICFKVSLSLS
jgi:hypothetical protein